MNDKEFEELEDQVYDCLYEQEISDIYKCKYINTCSVCEKYLDEVERRYPFEVKRSGD